MTENPPSLKRVKTCIVCGHGNRVKTTYDHLYPKAIGNQPRILRPIVPFKPVVGAVTNFYPMCWVHHQITDSKKMEALGIGKEGGMDPVKLVRFIGSDYPITSNLKLRVTQLRCMINVTALFVEAVFSLNGELPSVLVIKYHDAGEEANELIAKLTQTLSRG